MSQPSIPSTQSQLRAINHDLEALLELTPGVPWEHQVRAFIKPELLATYREVLEQAGRAAQVPTRFLIDHAYQAGLLDDLEPHAAVEGHVPGGHCLRFRMAPRPHRSYQRIARELGVYRNSVSHLYGLALERTLALRPPEYWVRFFWGGEDILERVWRELEGFLETPPLSEGQGGTENRPIDWATDVQDRTALLEEVVRDSPPEAFRVSRLEGRSPLGLMLATGRLPG